MTLEQTWHLAGFTMILCCMCFLDSWFACIFFFFCFVLFHDTILCVLVFVFHTHLVLFVCSLTLVGCTSCVYLCCHFLSSAGVWATESKGDHSGSTHQLDSGSRCGVLFTFSAPEAFFFVTAFSLFFGFLWLSHAKHFSRLIFLLTFSESEIPSQERKNYKSSPEIQVG